MKMGLLMISVFLVYQAQAMPIVDTAQAIKQYTILLKQLKTLEQQALQVKEMIHQGKKAIKDMEGHYGYGTLLDSETSLKQKEWTPNTWDDALQHLSGGNITRYQELLSAYKKQHYVLTEKKFSKGASQSLTKNYQNLVNNNQAAMAITNYEYENIKPYLEHIHQLIKRIESTPNTKAAIDLNSRLIAELSYISAEELRMQIIMNRQLATNLSDEIEARSRESYFNQLPTEKPHEKD